MRTVIFSAIACSVLAGCGSTADQLGALMVSPGKYELYNCQQITDLSREKVKREAELRGLMDRTSDSQAGATMGVFAYKLDHATTYSEVRALQEASVQKNCEDRTRSVSERSVR